MPNTRSFPQKLPGDIERDCRVVVAMHLPFRLSVTPPQVLRVQRPGTDQHAYVRNLKDVDPVKTPRGYAGARSPQELRRMLSSRISDDPKGYCSDILLVFKPRLLKAGEDFLFTEQYLNKEIA